ncbi:DUF1002 domain-containing protein [Hathewaya histolytica]|uniref:DUF1002 domain-containing protein n=1 Tax=Hathewaya histolytica TaxID=1498 RepID=UPI003B67935B
MKFKKIISKLLIAVITVSAITTTQIKTAYADAFKVVTLGSDLSKEQKEEMIKYFGVTKNDANILEVTSKEEYKYLGDVASKSQLGTKSISCSFIEPTDKGGINVSTNNIYWVTESMIKNALITAGIENANVKASAPFKVSGTAALTGILKGFENSKGGEKIDENKKKVANEELVVTGKVGEKIGKEDAANLINEVKKDVIKKKPKTEKEIEKIVVNVTNNYGSKLNDSDVQKITALMNKINGLDLDFSKLKGQLNDVTKNLKNSITGEEAKGFWGKIKGFFSDVFDSIGDFFSGLFSSDSKDSKSKDVNTNKSENKKDEKSNKENKDKSSINEESSNKAESADKAK